MENENQIAYGNWFSCYLLSIVAPLQSSDLDEEEELDRLSVSLKSTVIEADKEAVEDTCFEWTNVNTRMNESSSTLKAFHHELPDEELP